MGKAIVTKLSVLDAKLIRWIHDVLQIVCDWFELELFGHVCITMYKLNRGVNIHSQFSSLVG